MRVFKRNHKKAEEKWQVLYHHGIGIWLSDLAGSIETWNQM